MFGQFELKPMVTGLTVCLVAVAVKAMILIDFGSKFLTLPISKRLSENPLPCMIKLCLHTHYIYLMPPTFSDIHLLIAWFETFYYSVVILG